MPYRLYKFVHKVRHPGVVHLTRRAYRRQPLRAWETAVGLGIKRNKEADGSILVIP